ncbi:MAG: Holliday junction resolvase RuvX [Bacteroidota bacterium]|nr:Holliday junction resolvase RuvX [Bacteroidota bacterium]
MRILCIDWGAKRTGIAVTDPLKIIASALTTVETKDAISFLKKYTQQEAVELFLIGMPFNLDDSQTHATLSVQHFINRLKKEFAKIPVKTIDERYTSKMAVRAMIDMGMKKKERRKKENVDSIAATLMLQEYLNTIS